MTVSVATVESRATTVAWRADVRAALPGWVAARALVAVALAVSRFDGLAQDGASASWPAFAQRGLLGWDADWYQRIAVHGYGALPDEGVRFFPLFPTIGRVLGAGSWVVTGLALLAVANLAALAAGALVHRLALRCGADPATARRAATCFALASPAFVLVMAYSEGLAISLALVVLLALLGRHHAVAAGAGFLAGLARPTGVLLAVPAAVAWLADERAAGWRLGPRLRLRRAATVLAPAVGTAVYLAWCQVATGRWSAPYDVQGVPGLRGDTVDPFTTLGRALVDLVALRADGHQLTVVLATVLLLVGARRWPALVTAWGAVTLLAAFSAERLGSMERYAWAAIVPVLTLATLGPRSVERALPVALGAGFLALATLAFTGRYVP